jgi:hypothetical protein
MTDRELFEITLDALEEINKLSVGENAICLPAEIDTAMDALRERLAQLKPLRPWVGLTNGERINLWREFTGWGDPSFDDENLMKAIEFKLKEKNA